MTALLMKLQRLIVLSDCFVHAANLNMQRSSCLPDENNVAALQEELKQMKLRELETLRSFKEMQDSVAELNQCWQVTFLCSILCFETRSCFTNDTAGGV